MKNVKTETTIIKQKMKRTFVLFLLMAMMGYSAVAQSKKEQIAILQHAVDSLSSKVMTLNQELSQYADENNRLVQDLNNSRRTVDQLMRSKREADERIEKLLKSKKVEDAEIAKLQKMRDDAHARIAALTKEVAELREQLSRNEAGNADGFEQIYEFSISNHPQYKKAVLLAGNEVEEGSRAIVRFYDRNGSLVRTYEGWGSWNARGFLAYFEEETLSIGVMGMGVGPMFTENDKGYTIKIVKQ